MWNAEPIVLGFPSAIIFTVGFALRFVDLPGSPVLIHNLLIWAAIRVITTNLLVFEHRLALFCFITVVIPKLANFFLMILLAFTAIRILTTIFSAFIATVLP